MTEYDPANSASTRSSARHPIFDVLRILFAEDSPFTATERLVAAVIAQHMDGRGRCWPSMERIARCAGLGLTAVRQACRSLTSGPNALFGRSIGGAKRGDRYASSTYTFKSGALEGSTSRGARQTRGSRGALEGSTSRAQGVRQVDPNVPSELLREQPHLPADAGQDTPDPFIGPTTDNGDGRTDGNALDPEHVFNGTLAADVYLRHRPKAVVPKPMFKVLKPLTEKHGWPAVESELGAYLLRTPDVSFQSWPKFAEGFGTWAQVALAPRLTRSDRNRTAAVEFISRSSFPSRGDRDREAVTSFLRRKAS